MAAAAVVAQAAWRCYRTSYPNLNVPTPTPMPSTSTKLSQQEFWLVEPDQNYKFAYIHGYLGQVVRASGAITRAEVAAIF